MQVKLHYKKNHSSILNNGLNQDLYKDLKMLLDDGAVTELFNLGFLFDGGTL